MTKPSDARVRIQCMTAFRIDAVEKLPVHFALEPGTANFPLARRSGNMASLLEGYFARRASSAPALIFSGAAVPSGHLPTGIRTNWISATRFQLRVYMENIDI